MNQKNHQNPSAPSRVPPAYIPPVQQPGQRRDFGVSPPPAIHPPAGMIPPAPIPQPQGTPASPMPAAPAANIPGPPSPAAAQPASPSPEQGQPAQNGVMPPRALHPAPAGPTLYQPIPRKEREDYRHLAQKSLTPRGSAAVLFSILFCMFYSELVLWGNLGISLLILTSGYYAFCFWYFSDQEGSYSPASLLLTLPVAVITFGLCLTVSSSTYFITVPFHFCLLAAQTALLGGMRYRAFFSWETFGALWAHLIDGPLSFLDFPILVMRGREKGVRRSKSFWIVFTGFLCAVPVAGLLLWLFANADAMFRQWLNNIAQWLRIDWWHLFTDLLVGFFVGILLAAVLLYCRGALKKDPNPVSSKRFLDPLFAVPFLGLIDLSVLAFTLVQFAYLFGGSKGDLPGGYTYAEYARQGFFELAAALGIVFAIAAFVMAFSKRERPGLQLAVRLELLVLILGAGVILASAVKRMLLYVDVFGLSVRRGLTLWFMATAGLCFLFLAAKCLVRRFPMAKCAGIAVTAMVCLLSLFPMDAFVARYNVNAYLAGRTEVEVDYYYLRELSVSSLPAMVDLYFSLPYDEDLEWAIRRQISDNEDRHPIWGCTLDQIGIRQSVDLFLEAAGREE